MGKKILSMFTVLSCAAMALAGCSGGSGASDSGASSSSGDDRVVIYTAAEDERIAYIQEELNKQFPDTEIVIIHRERIIVRRHGNGIGIGLCNM